MRESGSHPVRVLFITTTMTIGGSGRYIALLLEHLDRSLISPQLAMLVDAQTAYDVPADVRVRTLQGTGADPAPPPMPLPDDVRSALGADADGIALAAAAIEQAVLRIRPDVVFATPEHTAALAALAAERFPAGVRLVCRIPALPADSLVAGSAAGILARQYFQDIRFFVANSSAIAEELASGFGVPAEAIRVLPNPLDIARIARDAIAPVDDIPIDSRDATLVYVGRLERLKGLDVLLRAVAEVREAMPVRALLIGEGSQRGYLQALAKHLGIAESVTFAGAQANPFRFMSRSAALVLPSRSEGMPNVLLEAMACGCAVIASDIRGGITRELLQQGRCGVLVPPGDPAALAGAIAQLLQDASRRESLRTRGLERVTEFDLPRVMSRTQEVLREIAAAPVPATSRSSEGVAGVVSIEVDRVLASGDRSGAAQQPRLEPRAGLADHVLRARALAGRLVRRGRPKASPQMRRAAASASARNIGMPHLTVLVTSPDDPNVGIGLESMLRAIGERGWRISLVSIFGGRMLAGGCCEDQFVLEMGEVEHSFAQVLSPDLVARFSDDARWIDRSSAGLAALARELGTDVLISHGPYPAIVAGGARDVLPPDVALVAAVHRPVSESLRAYPQADLYAALLPEAISACGALIATSDAIAQELADACDGCTPVTVVPDCVDAEAVAGGAVRQSSVERPPLIVARLGADAAAGALMADAIAIVREQADARFALLEPIAIGEGVVGDLSADIIRHHDSVESAARLAGQAACFIDLAPGEATSISPGVVCAAAAGCPVIVPALSTNAAEFLGGGSRGVVLGVVDADTLAESVLQVLWDDAFRRDITDGALAHLSDVAPSQVAPAVIEVLERVISARTGEA